MFHPDNQHHGGGALPIKPVSAPLYVVTCISNPKRYRQRYHLFRAFEKYVTDSGGILYTIEQGFGDREFEITGHHHDQPRHFRIQSTSEIWHKENMLNLLMQHLPHDWKYVAWVDADVEFARPDWVYETLHLLQHYDFIQMFSQAVDLDPHYEILDGGVREGMVASWARGEYQSIRTVKHRGGYGYGAGNKHPGYAWAARRDALNHVGGLIDWAIVGSADWHMAAALVGELAASIGPHVAEACPNYLAWCQVWEDNATRYIRHNVGFMDGLVMHYYHGKKANRRYFDRWKILSANKFDPALDLKRDWQGLWQLTDRNIKLRDDLRRYFAMRDEDDRA